MEKRTIKSNNGYTSLFQKEAVIPNWKRKEVKKLYEDGKNPREIASEIKLSVTSVYDSLPLRYFYDVAVNYYGKESCGVNNQAEYKILKKMKLKGLLPKEESFNFSWK